MIIIVTLGTYIHKDLTDGLDWVDSTFYTDRYTHMYDRTS